MAGSNATKCVFGELAKRVPSNQTKQFRKFLDINSEYKRRVDKYPERLPRIDWDYYRTNVRVEAIKMVDEFEKKYEELNKIFDDRFKLDTRKYYDELESQRAEVQAQVKQYIAESNERIKAFETEIARLCHMKPYSAMTMEEFINLRPECSEYIPHRRKPLFWPHDPDEQMPGPADKIKFEKSGQGGEGDGDGGRVSGGTHPIRPSEIVGKTEKFELGAADGKSMQEEMEPISKRSKKETEEPKSLSETKIYIEKPQETKEKLAQPRKKTHPCDLIKHKQDSAVVEGGTCKPKGSYEDEDGSTPIFFDPCGVGFGIKRGDKSDVETVVPKTDAKPKTEPPEVSSYDEQPKDDKVISKSNEKVVMNEPKIHIDKPTPKEVKNKLDPCKIMEKEGKERVEAIELQGEQKTECLKTNTARKEKLASPKKSHPCDLIEKLPDDLCKPLELTKNEKETSAFFDPCNVGVSGKEETGEAVSKAKSKPQTKSPEKLIQKSAELDLRTDKDLSKELSRPEKKKASTFLDLCAIGFGANTDTKPDEPKPQAKEPHESSSCNSTKQKQKRDNESCKDRDSDIPTKSPYDAARKPKIETSIIKNKNSVTMVFAERKEKLSKDGASKRQSTPSKEDKSKKPSPATPYYNPFRSEEENKKIEDEMCEVSKKEDPCSSKIRNTEEEFYDPCKDEKE